MGQAVVWVGSRCYDTKQDGTMSELEDYTAASDGERARDVQKESDEMHRDSVATSTQAEDKDTSSEQTKVPSLLCLCM